MTMSLTVLDLTLIGVTSGLTTVLAMYMTMRLVRQHEKTRKRIVMEEMLSQMHDQAKNNAEFEEIIERLKGSRGEFNDRGE